MTTLYSQIPALQADKALQLPFRSNRRLFGHNPLFSPDRRYIWDPYQQRWVPNRSGGGCMGFLLGIIITIALLKLLGGIR